MISATWRGTRHALRPDSSRGRRLIGLLALSGGFPPGPPLFFLGYVLAVLLSRLVETSAAVTETPGRLKKIALLADCLAAMAEDERAIGARYLAGEIPQKTGIGYATAAEVERATLPASEPVLTLGEVDRRLDDIARLAGPGSATARKAQLGALLARATAPEQTFLARLAVGELRQGALHGVVVEAIAKASGKPAPDVDRKSVV